MIIAETKRLSLEKFDMFDLDEYFEIISNDDLLKKFVPGACPSTLQGAARLLSHYVSCDFNNSFSIIIKNKQTLQIIGSLQAYKISSTTLHVSYLLGEKFRNKGFMKEALGSFIDYILQSNKAYSSFRFTIEKDNIASENVVKSFGATVFRELDSHCIWQLKIKNF